MLLLASNIFLQSVLPALITLVIVAFIGVLALTGNLNSESMTLIVIMTIAGIVAVQIIISL